jgi:hypothetical protein
MRWALELHVGARGVEGIDGARLRLTRSAVAFPQSSGWRWRDGGAYFWYGFLIVGVRERRLLLSWAKAGKDSKESREAARSEGDHEVTTLRRVLLARSCAMEGEDVV